MGLNDRDWFGDQQPPEPPMPDQPSVSIADGAVAMHELYQSYVAAGFTPDQSLKLVIATMQMFTPKT